MNISGFPRFGRLILLPALAGLLAFGGCATPQAPLRPDHTAVISGRNTVNLNRADTVASVMTTAAEITVDHGFRYFGIVSANSRSGPPGLRGTMPSGSYVPRSADSLLIQPGKDTVIRLYSADEFLSGLRVWDAQRILTQGPKAAVAELAPK